MKSPASVNSVTHVKSFNGRKDDWAEWRGDIIRAFIPCDTVAELPVKLRGTPRACCTSAELRYPAAHRGGNERVAGEAMSKWKPYQPAAYQLWIPPSNVASFLSRDHRSCRIIIKNVIWEGTYTICQIPQGILARNFRKAVLVRIEACLIHDTVAPPALRIKRVGHVAAGVRQVQALGYCSDGCGVGRIVKDPDVVRVVDRHGRIFRHLGINVDTGIHEAKGVKVQWLCDFRRQLAGLDLLILRVEVIRKCRAVMPTV